MIELDSRWHGLSLPRAMDISPILLAGIFYIFVFFIPFFERVTFVGLTFVGLLLAWFLFRQKILKKKSFALFSVALSLTIAAVEIHNIGRVTVLALIPFVAWGMMLVFVYVDQRHVQASMVVVLIGCSFVAMAEQPLNAVSIMIGQNGLTLHLLAIYVVYFVRVVWSGRSIRIKFENYLVTALIFTISVWSQGRSATIVASLVMCGAFCMLFPLLGGFKRAGLFLLTLAVVGVNVYSPVYMAESVVSGLSRIAWTSDRDIRFRLWFDYVFTLDFQGILFGNLNSNCRLILGDYSNSICNIHNSYIHVHQAVGIAGLVALTGAILVIFRRLISNFDIGFLMVVVSVLLRVATEEYFFVTIYLAVFYLIFLASGMLQEEGA